MFKDVPLAMVNAAARPFSNMIQEKSGLKGNVEVVSDYKMLAEKLGAGTIDIGVFHGFEYAWIKDTPGLVPLVATVPNCGKVQACLVVNVESTAKEPKDLKGACVLVPKSSKAHCHMYLERIRASIPAGDCCPAQTNNLTPEEALGEVAAGNADAALVDISALIALKSSLPGCYKQLRVLAESEQLPSAVVVYRKGALPPDVIEKIRIGLIDCVKTPMGKTFALFWQLKGFEDVTDAYHAQVAKSLKAYPSPSAAPPAAPPATTATPK
jgi:ABC-type phosphate/phosphonate transport system substrate-binding protein